MLHIIIVVGILVCAVEAIQSPRLLVSAIWLAGTSALVGLLMYLLGAAEVAVIELSVGAGLVTVLFVFAINLTGEERVKMPVAIPKQLAWVLILLAIILLGWFVLPDIQQTLFPHLQMLDFRTAFWESRKLDLFLQIILIFAGVLGVLGLLSEDIEPSSDTEEQP